MQAMQQEAASKEILLLSSRELTQPAVRVLISSEDALTQEHLHAHCARALKAPFVTQVRCLARRLRARAAPSFPLAHDPPPPPPLLSLCAPAAALRAHQRAADELG